MYILYYIFIHLSIIITFFYYDRYYLNMFVPICVYTLLNCIKYCNNRFYYIIKCNYSTDIIIKKIKICSYFSILELYNILYLTSILDSIKTNNKKTIYFTLIHDVSCNINCIALLHYLFFRNY